MARLGVATSAALELEASIKRGKPDRAAYLKLRRSVAAMGPMLRLRAELSSEVLLGPPRSIDETGGALAMLDVALMGSDRAALDRAYAQVARSVRLAEHELRLNRVTAAQAIQAASDVAFELGLGVLEAYPAVPEGADAVLADLQGMLDAIDGYPRVALAVAGADETMFEPLVQPIKALRSAFDAANDSHELRGRARLVQSTGPLGVELRRLSEKLGHKPKLPYRVRTARSDNGIDERVTAFSLPAPRRDLRAGDRQAMARIGQRLFFDRRLSRDSIRACADCHQPARAFTDGMAVPPSLDPEQALLRNTPTLLYTSLHASQLWDGRFASAERQAIKVIHTVAEMGLSSEELERVVSADERYLRDFAATFSDGVRARNVARALVAFEIEALVPGTAPMDRFAAGELGALDDSQRRGLDLFSGRARCARCHIPPLFGGSRPPDFTVPVFAVLGVPARPDGKELDPDEGRGKVTERPLDHGAFKTPTVRNVDRTGPFFHHGRFPTLEQVVDFYDKGGGVGLKLDVPNQDPDVRKLDLSAAEKTDLLGFMRHALRDAQMPLLGRPAALR